MKGIYLLLGSNLGDSRELLKRAYELIADDVGQIKNTSSIYVTKAWGITDQPDFLNQVLEMECDLDPVSLLEKINEIENKEGDSEVNQSIKLGVLLFCRLKLMMSMKI